MSPATLAHAISTRTATAAKTAHIACRSAPSTWSKNGVTTTAEPNRIATPSRAACTFGPGLADVTDRDDGRVIQGGCGTSLAFEPPHAFGVLRDIRGKNLEGNIAREARVVRAVHLAHTSRAEPAEDLVRPETRSRSQRHGRAIVARGPRERPGPLLAQGRRRIDAGGADRRYETRRERTEDECEAGGEEGRRIERADAE